MEPPQKLVNKKRKALAEDNQQNIASSCVAIANFYNENGNYTRALEEFKEAANSYNCLGDRMNYGIQKRMVGEMYMQLGELNTALEYETLYLKIALEENNKIEIQRAYATLGRAYLLKAQNSAGNEQRLDLTKACKNAEKSFIKSLLVCKELDGQISNLELNDMKARLYLNLSVVKETSGDLEKSLEHMTKAIAICKNSDLFESLHQCYMSIGILYSEKLHDSANALRYLNLALEVGERLENKVVKCCQTLIIKGDVLVKLGDYQSAKQVLHKAYKYKTPNISDRESIQQTLRVVAALCNIEDKLIIADSNDYKLKKGLYEQMGDGSCKLLNFKQAINYYEKMLECAQKGKEKEKEMVPIYISLYQTYKDIKKFDKALEFMWKEYELCKDWPEEAFNTLVNIAEVNDLSGNDFWDSENILQKAKNCALDLKNEDKLEIVYIKLLQLQAKHGMIAQSEALEEEIRNSGFNVDSVKSKMNATKVDPEEEVTPDEGDTPNIGDDICLDDLSDSGSENEEAPDQTTSRRPSRKRNIIVNKIKRNNKGETQLHQACISGNTTLVKLLLDQGHPLNVRDNAGWLPLHEACNHGYKEIVELLLDNGGTTVINDKGGTTCEGITPLHDACSNGHLEVVELLLDRGANATLRTDSGETPLSCLANWRQSVDLDTTEEIFHDTIKARLINLMKKVGLNPEIRNPNVKETPRRRGSNKENANSNQIGLLRRGIIEQDDESSNESMPQTPKAQTSKKNHNDGADMYKKAIEAVRSKSYTDNYLENCVQEEKKRPAYLDSQEIDDDWLEDDIQKPDTKRRKYMPENMLPGSSRSLSLSSKRSIRVSKEKEPEKEMSNFIDSDNSNSVDAFDIIMQSKQKMKPKRSSQKSHSSLSSNNKQYSLLQVGVIRENIGDSNENLNLIPDSTVNDIILEISPTKSNRSSSIGNHSISSSISGNILTLKVKIEDQLIVVPVKGTDVGDHDLKWLAENAAKRFHNIQGRLPSLLLTTTDGAIFDENDPLAIVVDIKPYISTKVLNWASYSLSDSYSDACKVMKQTKLDSVATKLQIADDSLNLELNNLNLNSNPLEPILKCIQHHKNLRSLNLSNNCLEDQGITLLSQALMSLPQLKSLNLSGNLITLDGIMKLENMFGNSRIKLEELNEFNLSYNPLGDESVQFLCLICNQLPKLTSLSLASCNFTSFGDFNLAFDQLNCLDISFNSFNTLQSLWINLNIDKVKCLDFGFAISYNYSDFPKDFIEAIKKSKGGAKLEELNLSHCNLQDADCWDLLRFLKNTNIKKLDLVQNNNLSSISLQYLLNANLNLLVLNCTGCEGILKDFKKEYITDVDVQVLPERIVLHLQTDLETMEFIMDCLKNLWTRHWGERARFDVKRFQVSLFVD